VEALTVRRAWPAGRVLALVLALLLLATSGAGSALIYESLDLRTAPDEYNIAAWEVRNLPGKWLFLFGQLFRGKPSLAEENEALVRFFELTREIDALERATSDAEQRGLSPDPQRTASLAEKRRERDRIENQVEAAIEGRLTRVLEQQRIERSFLFLPAVVWPPVDFEFTDAPRTLAVSPRERIELKGTSLLREDLSLAQIEAIEAGKGAEGLSALAFPTSGIGAYPTIVDYAADYRAAVETAAHEWTHNYLFFRPLGFSYYDSYDLRAMNETVADLVGRELAEAVVAAWPLPGATSAPRAPTPGVDVGAELRRLRGEVDALLAQGQVEAAEALMEQRRRELAAQGFTIRKLNQAYFAFVNLYAGAAGNPAATNPIGPKVDELRRRTGSLREFVRIAGGLTSVAGLDRALAELP